MQIGLVAGEASGDRHGAALVEALRAALGGEDELAVWGIGGVLSERAGVELLADSREWGSIGVVEAISKVPKFWPAMARMKQALLRRKPDAIILVDFGAFNIRLAKWVSERRLCPVLYYLPPGSWRRQNTTRRLQRLVDTTDHIVTPFPWSERHLLDAGANAVFVGHPLLDLVKTEVAPETFCKQFGLDDTRMVIALLPGSRAHEVRHNLPAMFSAAGMIASRVPGAQFTVALAPNVRRDVAAGILRREQAAGGAATVLSMMQRASDRLQRAATAAITIPPVATPALATSEGMVIDHNELPGRHVAKQAAGRAVASAPVVLIEGMSYDVIANADLVITASGTATLEAAILQKPMIIMYRGGVLMNMEWALRKRALALQYIGLPNILANRMVCPEFIAETATPCAIADTAVELLLEPERLLRMKEDLARVVREQLGDPGGIARAADVFLKAIGTRPTSG